MKSQAPSPAPTAALLSAFIMCVAVGGMADQVRVSTLIDCAEIPHGSWGAYHPETEGAAVAYNESAVSMCGRSSSLIDVPAGSTVTFYQYVRDVSGVRAGELYEFSAWVKTEDVAGGVGASISIGALHPEPPHRRFVAKDSERITGSRSWTQVKCALVIPEDVASIRLLLLLHGTGRGCFDGVRLRRLKTFAHADGSPVTVSVSDVVTTHQFLGFGVEDDHFFYTDENFRHGVTDEDVALRNRRIAELDPGVIAILFWWNAISPTHDLDAITYDSEQMRALCRTLDIHQAAGRTVFFSDAHWGWTQEQFAYSEENVERGVRVYVDLLRLLIQEKGYTCIRYVSITGEVDLVFELMGGSFESYITANRLLRRGLDETGLREVQIIGDKSGGVEWFRRALSRADRYFGIFAVHEYPDVTQFAVINHRLARALDVVKRCSRPVATPDGSRTHKPVFVWEIGYHDQGAGDTDTHHTAVREFSYGLLCANTAIAALNQGFVGGSVWCLHSMYYPGQNRMDYGLWEFKDREWRIRPIYYGYGLFTRFARAGMAPLRVATEPAFADFSAGVVRSERGRHVLFAVNLSEHEISARVRGMPQRRYAVYEYAEDRLPEMGDYKYGRVDALRTRGRWRPSDGELRVRARTVVMVR